MTLLSFEHFLTLWHNEGFWAHFIFYLPLTGSQSFLQGILIPLVGNSSCQGKLLLILNYLSILCCYVYGIISSKKKKGVDFRLRSYLYLPRCAWVIKYLNWIISQNEVIYRQLWWLAMGGAVWLYNCIVLFFFPNLVVTCEGENKFSYPSFSLVIQLKSCFPLCIFCPLNETGKLLNPGLLCFVLWTCILHSSAYIFYVSVCKYNLRNWLKLGCLIY